MTPTRRIESTQPTGSRGVSTGTRRSDRIRLRLSLELSSGTGKGSFQETAHTLSISANGATIVSKRTLTAGQTIEVRRGERSAAARVVGQVSIETEGHVYGIVLEQGQRSFWGVAFPPAADAAEAAARLVLRCGDCGRTEVRHLNEVELLVLESNHYLEVECEACGRHTPWAVANEELAGPVSKDSVGTGPAGTTETAKPSDRRRHRRMQIRAAKACILQPGAAEDVVEVLDVSRGGLRFSSKREYTRSTWVQVAVPYTSGAANIFISARVVRVERRPTTTALGLYALQYGVPDR